MGQFSIILNQIGGFIIYLAVGIFLRRKTKILTEESLFTLSELTIKVALPAFIFTSTVYGTSLEDFASVGPVILIMILVYVILFVVGILFCRIFGLKGNTARAYRLCLTFGNVGLVGVPIAMELYPSAAMIIIAVATVIDQLVMWTYGVNLSYDVESGNKERFDSKKIIRIITNPPLLAILISLVFVVFGWSAPAFVNTALDKIGSMVTPLGLIYVGGMLEWSDIKFAVKRIEIYVFIVFKMIVLPVFVYFIMIKMGIPRDMSGSYAVILSVPVFVAATILTKNNGSDDKIAAGMLMLSTVAFLITYPITSVLMSMI